MAISLERERAKLAWNRVSLLRDDPSLLRSYRSRVREFPAMVQSLGVGQAAAFLMSKRKDKACQELLEDITLWAFHQLCPIPWQAQADANGEGPNRLANQLVAEEPEVWWIASREIIAYAVWLKRFAESFA